MVLFRPVGVRHAERFGTQGATCGLLTPPPDWIALARDFGARPEVEMHVQGAGAVRLAEIFERECFIGDSFSALSLQAVLWETLVFFGRQEHTEVRVGSIWATRALEYLHDHSAEALSLSQVAGALGVHRGHLARTFRAAHGETLGARLRRIRVQRAAALIRGTTGSLIEIAARCGFAHQAHMTRVFRLILGVTPGQYRTETR
jgi:AraC-like DNA-binding protein